MKFDNFEMKINQENYDLIKHNMLSSRDSFDFEISKMINQFGKVKSIEFPHISKEERSQFHKYERTNIHIYSFGNSIGNELFKMQIEMKSPYFLFLKKKYQIVQPVQQLDIESLMKNFKQVLITDISEVVDTRMCDLIKNFNF